MKLTGYKIEKWDVQKVLDNRYRLWIPHFQRGQVWNDEYERLLFDSLFWEIPFGTIVLWAPPTGKNLYAYGEPLIGNKTKEGAYFVIDGQQRIKSICNLFNTDSSDEDDKLWCLNLRQIVGQNRTIEDKKEDPLFVHISHPKDNKNPKYKQNYIPTKDLLTGENIEYLIKPIDHWTEEEVLEELRKNNIIKTLKERKFCVYSINHPDFTQAIRTYIRINTAAIKVSSEEKAFATLVSIENSDANNSVRKIFESIHGSPDKGRETVFKREKESEFGFKLFIRVLIQVCSYKPDATKRFRQSDLGFDQINKSLANKLKDAGPEEWQNLWGTTGKLVRYVNTVLGESLYCDDLRFLPKSTSVTPIFQLLIRFPALMEKERESDSLLAGIILNIFLSGLNTGECDELTDKISKSSDLKSCIQEINNFFARKNWEKKFKDELKKDMSLQNPYILLLYWLLRKNGCKDFSYKANMILQEMEGKEYALDKDCKPEKQHMIPLSKLGKYGIIPQDEERIRSKEDKVNNIGQITYLSHEENGLKGLSENFVNIGGESSQNLRNHLMLEQGKEIDTSDICQTYLKIKNGKCNEGIFKKFCDYRRKLISKDFLDWVDKLWKRTEGNLKEKKYDDMYPSEPILKDKPKLKGVGKRMIKGRKELQEEARKNQVEGEFDYLYEEMKRLGCTTRQTQSNLEIITKIGTGRKTIISVYPLKSQPQSGLYVIIKMKKLSGLGIKESILEKNISLTNVQGEFEGFLHKDEIKKLITLLKPYLTKK